MGSPPTLLLLHQKLIRQASKSNNVGGDLYRQGKAKPRHSTSMISFLKVVDTSAMSNMVLVAIAPLLMLLTLSHSLQGLNLRFWMPVVLATYERC